MENYRRVVGLINPRARTKLCIGLDLDECLVSTMPPDIDPKIKRDLLVEPEYADLRRRFFEFDLYDMFGTKGEGMVENFWGLKRPHLDTFLLFIMSYFRIVFVWSAGRDKYVNNVVEKIFKDIPHPYIVMNFDDVEAMPSDVENYHKPLRRAMSLDPENMNYTNTLFLDNKGDNFVDNPENGIVIRDYRPRTFNEMMTEDVALLQLRQWLLKPEVMNARDVRTLDKSRIFLTPPMDIASSPELVKPFGNYANIPPRPRTEKTQTFSTELHHYSNYIPSLDLSKIHFDFPTEAIRVET